MAIPDSGYFITYPENGLFMKCIKTLIQEGNPAAFMPPSNLFKKIK
jgi:hypothetical protein